MFCKHEKRRKAKTALALNESRFSSWARLVPECKESAGCGHKVGNARSDHRGPEKHVVTRRVMQKYKITDGTPAVSDKRIRLTKPKRGAWFFHKRSEGAAQSSNLMILPHPLRMLVYRLSLRYVFRAAFGFRIFFTAPLCKTPVTEWEYIFSRPSLPSAWVC